MSSVKAKSLLSCHLNLSVIPNVHYDGGKRVGVGVGPAFIISGALLKSVHSVLCGRPLHLNVYDGLCRISLVKIYKTNHYYYCFYCFVCLFLLWPGHTQFCWYHVSIVCCLLYSAVLDRCLYSFKSLSHLSTWKLQEQKHTALHSTKWQYGGCYTMLRLFRPLNVSY